MVRQRKDYVAVSFKLDKSIYNKLDEYCTVTGMPKTVVVEKALTFYFKTNEKYGILHNNDN